MQDSDAADVTQEVFAVISRSIDSYDENRESASFRGWLWGVTRNKLLEHHRRQSSQAEGIGGTDAQ